MKIVESYPLTCLCDRDQFQGGQRWLIDDLSRCRQRLLRINHPDLPARRSSAARLHRGGALMSLQPVVWPSSHPSSPTSRRCAPTLSSRVADTCSYARSTDANSGVEAEVTTADSSSDDDGCDGSDETPCSSGAVTPEVTHAAVNLSGWCKKWVVSTLNTVFVRLFR